MILSDDASKYCNIYWQVGRWTAQCSQKKMQSDEQLLAQAVDAMKLDWLEKDKQFGFLPSDSVPHVRSKHELLRLALSQLEIEGWLRLFRSESTEFRFTQLVPSSDGDSVRAVEKRIIPDRCMISMEARSTVTLEEMKEIIKRAIGISNSTVNESRIKWTYSWNSASGCDMQLDVVLVYMPLG